MPPSSPGRHFHYKYLFTQGVNFYIIKKYVINNGGHIMKHKTMYYSSIAVFIISIIVLFAGVILTKAILLTVGIVGVLAGFVFLSSATTYKKYWKCDKCKQTFAIGIWTYFLSNAGRKNQKRLHCPNCNKKTWCTGTAA